MTSNTKKWIKDSVTFKLITIGIISLLLLIPGSMIKDLIKERELTRNEVIEDIHSSWGNRQCISGPVISVPYPFHYTEGDKKHTQIRHIHFLPDELTIHGNVDPEIRNRSIYKVVVYKGILHISGKFAPLDTEGMSVDPESIRWDDAVISLGISDLRGIRDKLSFSIGDETLDVNPGLPVKDLMSKGVSLQKAVNPAEAISFSMELKLNGSESLEFIPLGKTTRVDLESGWDSPSFQGAYLPGQRKVDEDGFEASWTILHLNRNFPQRWVDSQYKVDESAFGVGLLMPVDQYQKSHRAVKYALMFIALTFLIFFFSEIMNRVRIHPVQYLLVGLALVVFFSLLLALAEHLGFSMAYLISSALTILIIVIYYHQVLKKSRATLLISFLLIALYVFLFTTLQMEDYALLMGSAGLFIALAIVMYISRNIDWYGPLSLKTTGRDADDD